MLAIWHAYWYERDRPIWVGQIDDFAFYVTPPPFVKSDGPPVFWHYDDHLESYKQRLRILNIHHPELGQIQAIDTNGLDYTVTMKDGRMAKLEAEEQPGTVYLLKNNDPRDYDTPWMLNDWRFYVEVEKL